MVSKSAVIFIFFDRKLLDNANAYYLNEIETKLLVNNCNFKCNSGNGTITE